MSILGIIITILVYLIGYVLAYAEFRSIFTLVGKPWLNMDRAVGLITALFSWLAVILIWIAKSARKSSNW